MDYQKYIISFVTSVQDVFLSKVIQSAWLCEMIFKVNLIQSEDF